MGNITNYSILDIEFLTSIAFSFRRFISKLPDKGEKIVSFRDKLLKELEHRNEVETAANLLSRLNIASVGKVAMTKLEWTGKYNDENDENTTKIVELDSDDEEDPFKILAQVNCTSNKTLIIVFVNYCNKYNFLCSNI